MLVPVHTLVCEAREFSLVSTRGEFLERSHPHTRADAHTRTLTRTSLEVGEHTPRHRTTRTAHTHARARTHTHTHTHTHNVKSLQQTLHHKWRRRHGLALRHEARCTCQCGPLAFCLPAQWVAGASAAMACLTAATGRRLGASARLGVAIVASATRLDSTLSQELPQALARVAMRSNARLASRKCDRPRSRQSTAC